MVKVNDYEVVEGLYYSKDYMWVKVEGDKVRIGVTDFAQKQLREIAFIGLPSAGDTLTAGAPFGTVESTKAITDLIAPISGTVEEINEEVGSKPDLLNEDPYGEGWLALLSPTDLKTELSELMGFDKAVEWHKKAVEEG